MHRIQSDSELERELEKALKDKAAFQALIQNGDDFITAYHFLRGIDDKIKKSQKTSDQSEMKNKFLEVFSFFSNLVGIGEPNKADNLMKQLDDQSEFLRIFIMSTVCETIDRMQTDEHKNFLYQKVLDNFKQLLNQEPDYNNGLVAFIVMLGKHGLRVQFEEQLLADEGLLHDVLRDIPALHIMLLGSEREYSKKLLYEILTSKGLLKHFIKTQHDFASMRAFAHALGVTHGVLQANYNQLASNLRKVKDINYSSIRSFGGRTLVKPKEVPESKITPPGSH